MYLVVLLYAMFASVFIIAKTGLEYSPPLFLVGTRMFFAGIVMLAYLYIFRRKEFTFDKSSIFRVILLAFFNIYLTNVCEVWGLKYLTSSKTCFIYSLSPFVSALLSYAMFSEYMSPKKWFGLLIGFLGFLPIMLYKNPSEVITGNFWVFSWAELAVLTAAISSVYGWIVLKQLVKEHNYSPLMANGLSMLIGGFMALVNSAFVEGWNPTPVTEYLPFLECSLLLLVISNMICYNLYGVLLRKYTATFMSFAGFTTPLFTALFGWFWLGEVVSWPFYLSSGIVFVGLLLFYQEELKGGYAAQQNTPQPEPA